MGEIKHGSEGRWQVSVWGLANRLDRRHILMTPMLFFCSKRHTLRSVSARLFLLMTIALLTVSCATQFDVKASSPILPKLAEKEYTSFDGDSLGYEKWVQPKRSPKTVIIGVHGISGHAGDYANLGEYLLKESQDTVVFAPETRGQGMDPVKSRRGDVIHVEDWYKDLYTFTGLVRKRYPKAKIVWFGESMGSLIVMHAYNHPPHGEKKPDALVISSPIVDVASKLPGWRYTAARTLAALLPKLRISLETLAQEDHPVVTADDIHEEQAAKNPWYIKRYTLRLLLALSQMADGLPDQAEQVACPVLVLHGGKDIFTSDASVKKWFGHFPDPKKKELRFYPGSYHLLMYDHARDQIFKDVSDWLKKMNL